MAKAFPKSKFFGFDYHQPSIDRAREIARAQGVADRATFERASAKDYPGTYDLVAFFDCLHDMGDPVGAAAHVKSTLAKDGTWMVVEPFGNDTLAENLNPIGRVFYAASTMIRVPGSLSQEVGPVLGTQAGNPVDRGAQRSRAASPEFPPRNSDPFQPDPRSAPRPGSRVSVRDEAAVFD